ncbi:MAG: peptidoglycan DD-metalloendopeptidase family protein [Clostridia bacterium]|nr:peptidoglycan DD-metalloendopeptidase family protein [Clostridia bacterium]
MKLLKYRRAAVAFLLCCLMAFTCCLTEAPVVEAKSKDQINAQISELEKKSKELEKEIAALKSQKAEQNKIKSAIEKQISNTQQQINLCNTRIQQFNDEIKANEAEIAALEADKTKKMYVYRCRMRSIHMNNENTTLRVLMGPEEFSEYLALIKFSKTMSVYNKRIIDEIIATQNSIDAKRADIDAKIAEQDELKKTMAAKKAELDKQVKSVNAVISEINADQKDVQNENKQIEKEIAALEAELAPYININTGTVYDGSAFTWPVPGHYKITSGFDRRWGTWHKGIDISDGNVYMAPIVAPADGVVVKAYNSCKHNYGKKRSCGCGSGWGNHIMIDHGNNNGNNYKSLAGHMTKTAVSSGQRVKKGQVIGYVGSTGYSTGWHCHFEIYLNGTRVDPMKYYNKVK